MPGSRIITDPEGADPAGLPPGSVVVTQQYGPRGPKGDDGKPGVPGTVVLPSASDVALGARVAGDAHNRLEVTPSGVKVGDGAHPPTVGSASVEDWQPSTTYKANTVVRAPDGTLQRAKTDFTSGGSFNPANWTLVGGGTGAQTATPNTFSALQQFTVMPEVHATASDATPIYGRTHDDGKTVGAWNANHDGIAGDLFHFTTGANTGASRTIADGATTSGSAVITSVTAAFVNSSVGGDLGKAVSGPGIPAGAKIVSVQSATQATLDKNATATASGVSLTIGAGPNANGAVIAIGVDNGATGIVVQNKATGIGLTLNQLASVASSTAFMLNCSQASSVAAFSRWRLRPTATKPSMYFDCESNAAQAGTKHIEVRDNGIASDTLAGYIGADVGVIDWRRTIQAIASNASVTPLIRVADEVANNPSETYLAGKTNGELGLRVYRWSGAGANMYAFGWVAESDRFKLKAAQGAAAKGSETLSTMIEVRASAGTGSKGQMGFFGATPTNRPTVSAAATDAATTQTLVNDIRTALVSLGLVA